MGAIEGGEVINGSSWHDEEKIFVSVRMRPLSQKEIDRNDISDWECINDTTIMYRNSLCVSERSMYPTAYTFDRVFRSNCLTRQVYEEGAKEVALSVVSGINASVFAYGQTSSGKTYTMSGITEHTLKDIFGYIERHKEREFFLKFSAMEIYNESVRDLLSEDITPLRLLDDPERGTIVEKLTEESLKDWNHFKELLSICEAQRQIGETALNEASSRSHQILRLTIESSGREFSGNISPSILSATVNFVDLAGSERASQSLSAGARLKEGCHINRSLLTLGTVIRKLSKGRIGHIPFRDSKLTRILQSSLGGNARTSIICTLSPARSHVEQSRNTLLFASCAKEVATNAQVNVVMSDKALVKHLQKEVARLESELRNPGPVPASDHSVAALLSEKDLQIAKLKEEIADLASQRDLAKSEAEALRRQAIDGRPSMVWEVTPYPKLRVRGFWENETSTPDILTTEHEGNETSIKTFDAAQYSDGHSGIDSESRLDHGNNFEDGSFHSHPSPQIPIPDWSASHHGARHDEIEEYSDGNSEDFCKEVRCIEVEDQSMGRQAIVALSLEEKAGDLASIVVAKGDEGKQESMPQDAKIDISSDAFVDESSPVQPPSVLQDVVKRELTGPRNFRLFRSRSCKASFASNDSFITFDAPGKNHDTPPSGYERDYYEQPDGCHRFPSNLKHDSQSCQNYSDCIAEDVWISPKAESTTDQRCLSSCYFPSEAENGTILREQMSAAKLVDDMESNIRGPERHFRDVGLDPIGDDSGNTKDWIAEFKILQKDVIRFWDACNVSLAHRTYFFLLFKGSPTDKLYMEAELRRLSLVKQRFLALPNGQMAEVVSSLRDLRRERQMLSKQLQNKLTRQEREKLFQSWHINLTSKNRSLQLADRLWTDIEDMDHIARSAQVVANLIGFLQPDQHSSDEMIYGCEFTPRRLSGKTSWWKSTVRSLL
ncbi:hypothetical protein MLD38_028668 [Melastoma candidum]|uniref:Uncharacterized protein n=1 Tax=Melastoma candidum TaxID=119954 RepID=A0ACB9N2J5_9MYRT|nr:hypothetical protein MLD38_028668 [Melastoma candidum]